MGKEGAERYRVYNLPKNCASPGVYEFGIVKAPAGAAGTVVPVYAGAADNVRARLQQYGRGGAHLEKGPRLFGDIFSKGYSVVFRWAPMPSKQAAREAEAELLAKYDYPWNREGNGARRPHDATRRLETTKSRSHPASQRRLQSLNHNKQGCIIDVGSIPGLYSEKNGNHLSAQIRKFGRTQPRVVLDTSGLIWENSRICGAALGGGAICGKPPVRGGKRCPEHKWMRTSNSKQKLIVGDDSNVRNASTKSHIAGDTFSCPSVYFPPEMDSKTTKSRYDAVVDSKTTLRGAFEDGACPRKISPAERKPIKEEFNVICGVKLGWGFVCEKPPGKGRVRCEEHKGMRVTDTRVEDFCSIKATSKGSAGRSEWEECSSFCGATTSSGWPCRNRAVEGNARCWMHKGRWAGSSFSGWETEPRSAICGALCRNGAACRRKPAYGETRCWQH